MQVYLLLQQPWQMMDAAVTNQPTQQAFLSFISFIHFPFCKNIYVGMHVYELFLKQLNALNSHNYKRQAGKIMESKPSGAWNDFP